MEVGGWGEETIMIVLYSCYFERKLKLVLDDYGAMEAKPYDYVHTAYSSAPYTEV